MVLHSWLEADVFLSFFFFFAYDRVPASRGCFLSPSSERRKRDAGEI